MRNRCIMVSHFISFHFCTLHFKFIFRSKKLICFFLSETGNYMEAENKYSRAMGGAPSDSLFGQFCLHALWFGNCNIRGLYHVLTSLLICDFWRPLLIKDSFLPAIAVLWIDFVREIRWCWEESERLPRMKSTSSIDLSSCLIHQKLQMVHQYLFSLQSHISSYKIITVTEKVLFI